MPPVASPDMPKPIEAMAARAKKDISPSVSNPDIQAAVKRGQELRKIEQDGLTGRALLESARQAWETTFDGKQKDGLQLKFGGGLAKDIGGGRIGLDPADIAKNPDAGIMFDSAKAAVDGATNMLTYTEVQALASQKGISALDAYRQKMGNNALQPADWDRIRNPALKQLENSQVVRQALPELFDTTVPNAERQAYLEAALASNPKLKEAIASKLTTALEQAKTLPEVSNPAFDQLNIDQKLIDAQITQKYDGLRSVLVSNGFQEGELVDPTTRADIEAAIKSGQPESVIRAKMQNAAIKSQTWGDLPKFVALDVAKAEVERVTQELKSAKPGSVLETKLEASLINAEKNVGTAETALSGNGKNEYLRYTKLKDLFAQQGGATGKGGDVNQELMSLVTSGKEFKQKSDEIALKQPDHDKLVKEKMVDRLRQESNITAGLENLLEDALSDVLESEYDEVIPLRQQELQAQAETMKSGVGKKITEAMGKNWIEYNQKDRKKEVHKDKIGADVRMLAYKGNEGVQRLLLRDLGEANWETIDLSTLATVNPKMQEQLAEANTTYADVYRDRLMTDFFAARGIWEKAGLIGKLHLKDHEWEQLERNFGEQMTESLNKSKHGKEALDRLKAAGFEPKGKKKWLLYILAMLGAGAIGVAVGPGAGVLAGAGVLSAAGGLEA